MGVHRDGEWSGGAGVRQLTLVDLQSVAGLRAAERILRAYPSLWVQEDSEGDVATADAWRKREPWDGQKLDLQFSGVWLTLPIAEGIKMQAVSAVAQAQLEARSLTVRVHEGFIMEIWLD